MYCSIQEAWGNKDTNIPLNINNNQLSKSNIDGTIPNLNSIASINTAVENFTDKDIEEFLAWKNNSNLTNTISKECLNIINHFKSCDKCKNYYYKINGNLYDLNSLISKIGVNLIDSSNKEIVVIFLIGIVLILIFHLFNR